MQKFPIPNGFPEILHDFAREILRDQPEDIIEYSAKYFEALRDGKEFVFDSKYNYKVEGKPPSQSGAHYNPKGAQPIDPSNPPKRAEGSINGPSQAKPKSREQANDEELPDINNPEVQKATAFIQKNYKGKTNAASKGPSTKLEVRPIPGASLNMSLLSFGNWFDPKEPEEIEPIKELAKQAFNAGINYFDTYGTEESLKLLGKVIHSIGVGREQYYLSMKLNIPKGTTPEDALRLLRQNLMHLETPYVDIVYCINSNEEFSIEETCNAMSELVKSKKARHWGTCGWEGDLVREAYHYCVKNGLNTPKVVQGEFTFFSREFESESLEIAQELGIGSIAYADLNIEVRDRMNTYKEFLEAAHNELGCSVEQMMICYLLKNKLNSCVLITRTVEELTHCLEVLNIYNKMSEDLKTRISGYLDEIEAFDIEQQQGGEEGGEEGQYEGEGEIEGGEEEGEEGQEGEGEEGGEEN